MTRRVRASKYSAPTHESLKSVRAVGTAAWCAPALQESRRLPAEPCCLVMILGISGWALSAQPVTPPARTFAPAGGAHRQKQKTFYAFVRRRLLTPCFALGYALTRAKQGRIKSTFVPGARRALFFARASARLSPLRRRPRPVASPPSFFQLLCDPGGCRVGQAARMAAAFQ